MLLRTLLTIAANSAVLGRAQDFGAMYRLLPTGVLGASNTCAWGINSAGEIVGTYSFRPNMPGRGCPAGNVQK